jgi:hypothetical protein
LKRASERFRTFARTLQDFAGAAAEDGSPSTTAERFMAVRCPSLSAKARLIAAATSAAITLAILAAIAVGFAADDEALPPRTASLRSGSCAIHRSDPAHAAAPARPSHTKGDQQCRAS